MGQEELKDSAITFSENIPSPVPAEDDVSTESAVQDRHSMLFSRSTQTQ
jgi:hypothetical protein